jgi:hypothetical protein
MKPSPYLVERAAHAIGVPLASRSVIRQHIRDRSRSPPTTGRAPTRGSAEIRAP